MLFYLAKALTFSEADQLRVSSEQLSISYGSDTPVFEEFSHLQLSQVLHPLGHRVSYVRGIYSQGFQLETESAQVLKEFGGYV